MVVVLLTRKLVSTNIHRSLLLCRRPFHQSALLQGGGGHGHDVDHHHIPPPLPPFARSPPRTTPMTENSDAAWDDGVAPELALDFDIPHISSSEALWTLTGALSMVGIYFMMVNTLTQGKSFENPALPKKTQLIDTDWANIENWNK